MVGSEITPILKISVRSLSYFNLGDSREYKLNDTTVLACDDYWVSQVHLQNPWRPSLPNKFETLQVPFYCTLALFLVKNQPAATERIFPIYPATTPTTGIATAVHENLLSQKNWPSRNLRNAPLSAAEPGPTCSTNRSIILSEYCGKVIRPSPNPGIEEGRF